jgi:hypothetical protein
MDFGASGIHAPQSGSSPIWAKVSAIWNCAKMVSVICAFRAIALDQKTTHLQIEIQLVSKGL